MCDSSQPSLLARAPITNTNGAEHSTGVTFSGTPDGDRTFGSGSVTPPDPKNSWPGNNDIHTADIVDDPWYNVFAPNPQRCLMEAKERERCEQGHDSLYDELEDEEKSVVPGFTIPTDEKGKDKVLLQLRRDVYVLKDTAKITRMRLKEANERIESLILRTNQLEIIIEQLRGGQRIEKDLNALSRLGRPPPARQIGTERPREQELKQLGVRRVVSNGRNAGKPKGVAEADVPPAPKKAMGGRKD